jgi:polyisoprenyl-phosphate glycosyltransferase
MRPVPRVSLVIPLFNEEANIPELVRRTAGILEESAGGPHEIIFVDDGSGDATRELIVAAARADGRIAVIGLSRNFGHQAALTAGLDHVRGDVAVVLDGDLQDNPDAIHRFVELYRQGYDVVYAQRVHRKEPLWLRVCYRSYYRLLAAMADVTLPLDAGDFGLISRRVLNELRRIPERKRYLRGLRAWVGFRQIAVPVERTARHAGRSKYSMWRLTKLALDGIFSFSIVPIRAAAVIGALALGASALFGLYAIYARLFLDAAPRGFTALTLMMVFLSGMVMFFLGVVGEYVGRIYEEVKQRPVYIADVVLRSSRTSAPARDLVNDDA